MKTYTSLVCGSTKGGYGMSTYYLSTIGSVLFIAAVLVPVTAFSNGGDQRVLGNEYSVMLSRSPFTPIADVETAMTTTFVDLQSGSIIQDDLLVTIRIGKGRGSQSFIYEEMNIPVEGGILDWSYTFEETGLHEIFFDFAYASEPGARFRPPDFLIDVQPPEDSLALDAPLLGLLAILLIALFILGIGVGKQLEKKT